MGGAAIWGRIKVFYSGRVADGEEGVELTFLLDHGLQAVPHKKAYGGGSHGPKVTLAMFLPLNVPAADGTVNVFDKQVPVLVIVRQMLAAAGLKVEQSVC